MGKPIYSVGEDRPDRFVVLMRDYGVVVRVAYAKTKEVAEKKCARLQRKADQSELLRQHMVAKAARTKLDP